MSDLLHEPNFARPGAFLVWDGSNFMTPPGQPTPNPDQMQGSEADKLIEFSGRTCYESMGATKSRSSDGFHKHLVEVNHSSVLAHAAWTFELDAEWHGSILTRKGHMAMAFLNRPGCLLTDNPAGKLRVRLNMRAVRQWRRWPCVFRFAESVCAGVGYAIQKEAARLCTLAGAGMPQPIEDDAKRLEIDARWVPPQTEAETWVSFYVTMSRGGSHEQVRHAHDVGISQRCFAADTEILVGEMSPNVRKIRIDELANWHNNGRLMPEVYSWSESEQRILACRVRRCWIVGKADTLLRVTTAQGIDVRCTPDHRWLLADGRWVEAKDLQLDDELRTTSGIKDRVIGRVITDGEYVYDLEVAGPPNFAIAAPGGDQLGIIVHNSTRFCDEDGSPWVPHPLLKGAELTVLGDAQHAANAAYRLLMASCKGRLGDNTEVGKLQATKQARGAARAVLGTALETRMVFSASLQQWGWQLFQRMAEAADGEIRLLYNDIFAQLKDRFPTNFAGWETKPASDGIGLVLCSWGNWPERYGWRVA